MSRAEDLQRLESQTFDVLIVGAGINGAVSAAALAARGLKVALIDRGDFGGGTSSQSSNLAWGGIKYLENGEYRLVWDLCGSRNELMDRFPSTVREIRFLATIERQFRRPAWLVYLGAVLYWAFGRGRTRFPKRLSRRALKQREPLVDVQDAVGGVEYSDCYLHDNDARFVWNFVRRARRFGAEVLNYVSVEAVSHSADGWRVTARDQAGTATATIRSRVLINACGPWADGLNEQAGVATRHRHVFSKGIHLVVDRMLSERRVLAFFASDGRLFFVMPMGPVTCIGTTDTRVDTPETSVTAADRDFVLANANELLALPSPLTAGDVIAERCGVRPLAVAGDDADADWIAMSRKHAIDVDEDSRHATIFGGKLTDCVNVGEEIVDIVRRFGLTLKEPEERWYGEPDAGRRAAFMRRAEALGLDAMADPRTRERLSRRLWRRYGEDAFPMLEQIERDRSSAERMLDAAEYLRCEIEHTARHEMIVTLEDFLRRRSKISLVLREDSYRDDPGLLDICRAFFGDDAEQRLAEYRQTRR